MKVNKHIQDLEFRNTDIVVEYKFIESELNYFSGTGQKEDVEIYKVLVDNVNITRLMLVYEKELEKIVLDNHLGNL
tara:strand:- start:5501 stop:5728 length:228 start_codon:yes stop_codon:yes gene_type:complete